MIFSRPQFLLIYKYDIRTFVLIIPFCYCVLRSQMIRNGYRGEFLFYLRTTFTSMHVYINFISDCTEVKPQVDLPSYTFFRVPFIRLLSKWRLRQDLVKSLNGFSLLTIQNGKRKITLRSISLFSIIRINGSRLIEGVNSFFFLRSFFFPPFFLVWEIV